MKEYNPDFVHVVTCGRTGSTLLAALLNNIDGYSIRGENLLAFEDLHQFIKKITHIVNAKHAQNTNNPWYNDINFNLIKQHVHQIIIDFLDHTQTARVVGYKEIRYHSLSKQALFNHLNFIRHITNNCKVIFLTRKMDDLLKSGWWSWDTKASKIEITKFQQHMAEYMFIRQPDPNYCFQISYEDILEKNNKLKSMFEFLGEEYNEERIQKVLDTQYSYRTGEEYDRHK